ncbi:MAG TPA: UDP-3-O-(3-hydroxymyristoyl)glucosamine N-acyltransferase [Alphaproteobacteria bacterium]|jgi:UDP-3-O-[3-hydroxymyristoyl] glucosamine N-acyltransferase
MADPRFFSVAGPFTLGQLADIAGASLPAGSDPGRLIRDVAPLDQAEPEHVSFLDNRRYVDALVASRAGACVVAKAHVDRAPAGMSLLLSEAPYLSFAKIARAFHPLPEVTAGIAPTAVVDASAKLGVGCRLDAGAVVGRGVELGARCHIGPNAVIGDGVTMGEDCIVGASASVSHSVVGARVYVYPGARIGQDGFGFASGPNGHLRIPQLGRVVVGNDVEIGANTSIDRGAGPDTVIGDGCMIDNLVQIGHNVQMGRGCVIVSQVGISGSTKLGDYVVVGGQAGLAGHLNIGSGVRIAAKSGVHSNIPAGLEVGGIPAVPIRDWRRQVARLVRMGKAKPATDALGGEKADEKRDADDNA